ncbi:MAG: trypsin-like peptidase domain-containing protein [Clostridia bacterium]|nr:trypsin-like peptidase domain-containing protein [Clostridia bacterium]
MKKVILSLFASLLAFLLSSCFLLSELPMSTSSGVQVTFVDGDSSETVTFSSALSVVYPELSERENLVFSGWYYDSNATVPVRAGDAFGDSVTLYAGWTLDYESVTNKIFDEYIMANLEVNVKSVKAGFFGGASNSKGSGVIFKEQGGYYYLLTNNHVVEPEEGYTVSSYTVTDCYGNDYSAALVDAAPEYDLSVLRISKGEDRLKVLELANEELTVGDDVIAIGQPGGLKNSVTYGEVVKIDVFEGGGESDTSEIDFPIIWHDAPVDHGSSGGMLLNNELELAGVNFAIGTKDDDSFVCGFAVGIKEVRQYLYSLGLL